MKHALIVDSFTKHGPSLRTHYTERVGNPKETNSNRFVWDYWHVPDQYTLVRTPAYHFFPDPLYMAFHRELVHWGRKNLGCWDISPPWLSYYIQGCKQELHSDVPHGPWAFVYSLSPRKIRFSGGETLLLKPEVLSYWKNFGHSPDRERSSFVQRIAAKQNRLVVFDPRIPHGVTEVGGTMDPMEARVVIHGWFTEPKTYVDGPLPAKSTEVQLNRAFDQLQEILPKHPLVQGTISLGLTVGKNGEVSRAHFLTNTLLDLQGETPAALNREILKIYRGCQFKPASGVTQATIPLIFS